MAPADKSVADGSKGNAVVAVDIDSVRQGLAQLNMDPQVESIAVALQ